MYEHLTPEFIKADILGSLALADTREGSYTNTLISTVAYEIWRVLQSLDAVEPMVFVDETSGHYIDKSANPFGIERKSGAKAKAAVTLRGTDGTRVEKGKVFLASDSRQYTLDNAVHITGGAGVGTLTAIDVGEQYNAPAGVIFRQLVNQSGLDVVESGAATGGADAETDAALVGRFNEFRRRPATSGNASHYLQWALEVDGIGAAKVMPLWAGPGTVKVLVVGAKNQPVDNTIVASCASHIEVKRPIGATVTVESAAGCAINVQAKVIIKPSTDAATVQEALGQALVRYFESMAFYDYLVVYNRVGYILLDIPGVVDFTQLTLNGGTADIAIGADEVPVVGVVGVTA